MLIFVGSRRMTWIRRFIAAALVPVLAVALVATSIVVGVNGTILNPRFYADTLRKTNVFDDVYAAVLPVLIERAELDVSDLPLPLDLSPEGLAAKVERVITPEWLEANVVAAIDAMLPYLVGDASAFEVSIELESRAKALAAIVPELLREAALYDYVLEEGLTHVVDRHRQTFRTVLPFGKVLTTEDVMDGLRVLAPEAWVLERVDAVLDEAVPYVTGEEPSFLVVLSLRDRAPAVEDVLRRWLASTVDGSAREFLLDKHVLPVAHASLGPVTTLPLGITLTRQEVLAAIGSALPREWVSARVDDAISVMSPYLSGRTAGFAFSIPVAEVAASAASSLAPVAVARARALYEALPECDRDRPSPLSADVVAPPACRPAEVTFEHFKIFVELDLEAAIEKTLANELPARIRLSDHELFAAPAGSDAAAMIDVVRRYLSEHYTLDPATLRHVLEERDKASAGDRPPAWERFEAVRARLRDGITVTDADLRARESFERFDRLRRLLGTGRRMLVPLVAALLAGSALIGFLGARRRGTRLICAAAPLLLGGLLVLAFVVLAADPTKGAVAEMIGSLDTERVFAPTLSRFGEELVEGLFGRLRAQGAVTVAIALALAAAGFIIERRARRAEVSS